MLHLDVRVKPEHDVPWVKPADKKYQRALKPFAVVTPPSPSVGCDPNMTYRRGMMCRAGWCDRG